MDKRLKTLGVMALGAFILAFGLYNVHAQSNITEGGILGTTLLLRHFLHISPSVSEVALDLACYLLAFRALGGGFAKRAAASTLLYAGWYALLERFPPLLPDWSAQPWVAAVVGGVFVGVGVGLVVRSGGACCGDDALALTISYYTRWPVARCYLFTDLTVLALSATYLPLSKLAWSLSTVTLSSWLIGRMTPQKEEIP